MTGSHDELYPEDSLTSEQTGHLAINEILRSHAGVASTWRPLSHTLSCAYSGPITHFVSKNIETCGTNWLVPKGNPALPIPGWGLPIRLARA